MVRFKDARSKIGRANIHIGEIEDRLSALHDTDAATVESHPQFGTERLKHTLNISSFDDLALVIGDAIHNLRCALDYTWLETIARVVPANIRHRAKFPVHKTLEEVEGALRSGNIDTACPNLFNFVLAKIKPCATGNPAIWPIHSFDNRDKHRLLIPIQAQGHITGLEVQDQSGYAHPGFGVSSLQRPPYFIDIESGLHFTKYGKLSAHIIIEDKKSGCSIDIPDTLQVFARMIGFTVEAFEEFLKSEGL
jgi:hypothetical protein